MIVGMVNSQFEPQIGVFVEDSNGQEQAIDVTIDTGFTGYMSLPPATISNLGLAWTQKRNVQLIATIGKVSGPARGERGVSPPVPAWNHRRD